MSTLMMTTIPGDPKAMLFFLVLAAAQMWANGQRSAVGGRRSKAQGSLLSKKSPVKTACLQQCNGGLRPAACRNTTLPLQAPIGDGEDMFLEIRQAPASSRASWTPSTRAYGGGPTIRRHVRLFLNRKTRRGHRLAWDTTLHVFRRACPRIYGTNWPPQIMYKCRPHDNRGRSETFKGKARNAGAVARCTLHRWVRIVP